MRGASVLYAADEAPCFVIVLCDLTKQLAFNRFVTGFLVEFISFGSRFDVNFVDKTSSNRQEQINTTQRPNKNKVSHRR